jgi:hypothetical protein
MYLWLQPSGQGSTSALSTLRGLKPSIASHKERARPLLVVILLDSDLSQLPTTTEVLRTWTGYQQGKELKHATQWEEAGLTQALASFIGES